MRKCAYCGGEYERRPNIEDWSCFCPTCTEEMPRDMSASQYMASLRLLHKRIKEGLELVYWDCTIIGNKETCCSWGFCSTDPEQWPDKWIHTWPQEFTDRGRVAPKRREKWQKCPFDRCEGGRGIYTGGNWGCFWRCMFFRHGDDPIPTRERALALIDRRIQNAIYARQDGEGSSTG